MIESIYQLADDALDSQGEIVFNPMSWLPMKEALQFRVTSFSVPEFSLGTYTIRYKTQEFTKPSGEITTPHSMSFDFRVDKYWTIYEALLYWKTLIANDDTGAIAEDVGAITGTSNYRTDFKIMTKDSNNVVTGAGWDFKGAFIKSLSSISFNQTSQGQPVMCTVTIEFLKVVPGTSS